MRCEDCGTEYSEPDGEGEEAFCPVCGAYTAQLVEGPGGTGRFWGYWGLRPVIAVRQVTPMLGIQAGRIMRRWYRAKHLTKKVTVQRVDRATGRIYTRRSTVRKQLFIHNRGFAVVNDGPAFATQLARYLNQLAEPGLAAPQ
jgi:hypothetical protein